MGKVFANRWRRIGMAGVVLLVAALAGTMLLPDGPMTPTRAVGTVGPVDAHGAAARVTPPGSVYVAMGSSYAAGPEAGARRHNPCIRTSDNYPHQVAGTLRLRLVDTSCSGAVTENILRTPQRPRLARPQILAVTPDTRLVTITIGGNDLDYFGRVFAFACANSQTARHKCARRARPEPAAVDYLRVEERIVAIVAEVRRRAPDARVVLVDYPPLVTAGDRRCAGLPLTNAELVQTERIHRGLVAATAAAAEQSGASLVAASRAGADHTVCSSDPWLTGYRAGVPFHPSLAGKAAVARLVIGSLTKASRPSA